MGCSAPFHKEFGRTIPLWCWCIYTAVQTCNTHIAPHACTLLYCHPCAAGSARFEFVDGASEHITIPELLANHCRRLPLGPRLVPTFFLNRFPRLRYKNAQRCRCGNDIFEIEASGREKFAKFHFCSLAASRLNVRLISIFLFILFPPFWFLC